MRTFFHKSFITFVSIIMFFAIVLAGCSGNSNNGNSSASGSNESKSNNGGDMDSTPGDNSKKPTNKHITLSVELFDRNNSPAGAPPITDNFMTQYIQKNFGDPNNITVKFVTVPRSEEVKKLNVLMASDSAPDLVFTYDKPTVENYVQSGGLTDLGPYIDKFGLQLKKVLAPTLKDGVFNGKQYTIPALRVIQSQTSTFIRKDWLDKLNLSLPKTTEEWYQAMKAFKEKDPGNTGGKVIPYTLIEKFHLKPLVNSFWDWSKITDEDLFADPDGWTQPGNKDAYQFLNKMYNEGLLNPDFALEADFSQKYFQQVVNGIAGSATPNTNEPVYSGYYANLKKNNPDAVLATIDPFNTKQGKHPKPMYSPDGIYLFVPKSSENAEAVIKYLNWMADPKNLIALQFGKEGVSYKMNEDGIPVALSTPEADKILFNNQDYAMIMNGKYVSTEDRNKNISANASDPQFKDFTINSIEAGTNDGYTLPRVDIPVQAEIKYSTILNEKQKTMLAKIITAKPSEFSSVYDKQVREWKDMGGAEMIKEKREAYKKTYNE